MASEYNLNGALLKLSISTEEAWANTTVVIPDGVVCYAVDRFQAKIGNGINFYMDLPYAFDSIPMDLKTFINEHTFVVVDENGTIPTGYFPKDVFNIHTAVGTLEDRNNLDIEVIRNSQLIFVADATDDPTVKAGFALYVAKFNSLWEYAWVKVGEQESIDFDFGEYLIASDTTIDQLADTDTYKRLTQEDVDVAVSALQATDGYEINLEDYLFWVEADQTVFSITGDLSLSNIESHGLSMTTYGTGIAISSNITRNGNPSIYIPAGSYLQSSDIQTLDALRLGTGDFTVETWNYMSIRGNNSSYDNLFYLINAMNGYYGLSVQYGNSTYGNRFMGTMNNFRNVSEVNYYLTSLAKTAVDLENWHHFAVSRKNGRVKSFYDGNMIFDKDSYQNTIFDINPVYVRIGGTTTGSFSSYFQDLFVTKAAKYTENFIPV